LGPFTILVGRNGAGKSNFLNALRLVGEGLRDSLEDTACTSSPWGGVAGYEDLTESRIELEIELTSGPDATYVLRLGIRPVAGLTVFGEDLTIWDNGGVEALNRCLEGRVVESSVDAMPIGAEDRLYLVRASGLTKFRPVYDALSAMTFHGFDPEVLRRPQGSHPPGLLLTRDGESLAPILNRIEHVVPDVKKRIVSYHGSVVPGTADIRRERWGPFATFVFSMSEFNKFNKIRYYYENAVSDDTLRALGILVTVNQLASDGEPIRLVGIEEPETALHPAAAGALMGALREASGHTQALVTTHSADFLDRFDPDEGDHLPLATMSGGRLVLPRSTRPAGRSSASTWTRRVACSAWTNSSPSRPTSNGKACRRGLPTETETFDRWRAFASRPSSQGRRGQLHPHPAAGGLDNFR